MNPLQRIHFIFTLLLVAGTACVVEGDDDPAPSGTTANTGNGSTTATTSGNGGSSNSSSSTVGSTGGSTGSTGGSTGGVESCLDLCNLTPVDAATAFCVAEFIDGEGYDTSDPQCDSVSTNTPSGCLGCYTTISVSDADCVTAYEVCF